MGVSVVGLLFLGLLLWALRLHAKLRRKTKETSAAAGIEPRNLGEKPSTAPLPDLPTEIDSSSPNHEDAGELDVQN